MKPEIRSKLDECNQLLVRRLCSEGRRHWVIASGDPDIFKHLPNDRRYWPVEPQPRRIDTTKLSLWAIVFALNTAAWIAIIGGIAWLWN